MTDCEILQLDIWKGDWGLPSINIECLQVLAYAKFNGVPLHIDLTSNPFKTPNGRLPLLRTGVSTLDTVKDIFQFLRTKYEFDSKITDECIMAYDADTMAYDALLKEKLYPALQYIWWMDKKNVDELVRPWYYKALPFPLNFYYPGKFEREAQSLIHSLYSMTDDTNIIETEVYSKAQKCLTMLSIRLGDRDYFYGSRPNTIDAIIYSYLAPLLEIPLPNPILQNHLKACTNLVKYVSRISQKYFKNEYQNYEKNQAEEKAAKLEKDSENEFPNKRRNQFLATFIAALAMSTYALSTGIVEVPVGDDEVLDMPTEYILNAEDDE